jgi:chemotaxis protein CheZ
MSTDTVIRQRLGALTRELHDALRALGYDRSLNAAAAALPDARDRLAYVATLTGDAAERVLAAVEEAQAQQSRMAARADALLARLCSIDAAAQCPDATRLPVPDPVPHDAALVADVRAYLAEVKAVTGATSAHLHTIMMAQDFHDLSGQVIKRVTEVAHNVESSLVGLLVETRPPEQPATPGTLSGPAIRASAEAVANQGEVDDLLASLGF